MKKLGFSIIAVVAFSFISIAKSVEIKSIDPSCDDEMFNVMDWAMEEGFDDQTVSNMGNWAYANCWLRQNSESNPSF
ncbi:MULTISPECIES: hypothetical protein [Flavobacterium]|jgi:hypothetical protein|uniref:Uncharacterized protein n=1 Tax=Flavobacterium jumunjinense TaxID=998845 RepID=A0ABV5GLW6_9FLAO|nr:MULTISPECIES: hypothetical protein [Flavobacterium]